MSSRFLPCLLFALLLTACGQKGPLYVPESPETQEKGNPAAGETAGENDDEKDDQEDDGKGSQ